VGSMPHRFRLVDEAGNDLGPLASRRSEWLAGERIARWHDEELEVVAVVPANEAGEIRGYIVVRSLRA
jgi:hypothetical protein